MEALIEPIVKGIQAPLSYVLGALVVILVLGPQIAGLYREWLDVRLGRRTLELERDRLQVLKLKYEIDALRQQYSLPEPLGATAKVAAVTPASRPAPRPAPAWVRWLLARPRLGTPVLLLLQAVFGLMTAFSAAAVIAVPVALLTGPSQPGASQPPEAGISPTMVLVVASVYALFALGFWVGYRRVRRWRRAGAGSAAPAR